jgi:hypothetical protein
VVAHTQTNSQPWLNAYRAVALAQPLAATQPHEQALQRRDGLGWRLAAVVAVSAQMVSALGGVLLLGYWIWASIYGE